MIDSVKDNLAEAVFQSSVDPIIIADLGGKILSINKSTEALLGYSNRDLAGSPLYRLLLNGGDESRLVSILMREGRVDNLRLKCYRKDKSPVEVNLTASLLRDGHGLPCGIIAILEDVTSEVLAEDRIREYISQMKEYVRQVENLNILKDLFTDILRHDIINPVTVIKNVSSALLTDEAISGHRDRKLKLELIKKNVCRIERIIENATLYGKLENLGELPLYEENLWLILERAKGSVAWVAKEKGIEIRFHQERKAEAEVNPLIEDAFANLLSNAVKYSPRGSRVEVWIQDEGKSWLISVTDEGEGIPDEYKETIFERFERGGRNGVKGSGLGLAIVKRIAELHMGEVWVEDNHPRGSRFCLRVPKSSRDRN
jgi:PAS domain S-box-containing protein